MFHGYVQPEFRGKGLYKAVNYDLASKLVANGQPATWAYVVPWNQASLEVYRKMGAKQVDRSEYEVGWCMYKPT